MENLTTQEKADAREQFENQLRCAFVKYDNLDEEEDSSEVKSFELQQFIML